MTLRLCLISHRVVYMKALRNGCTEECQTGDSFEDLCPRHHEMMVMFYVAQDAMFEDTEKMWEETV